MSEQQYLPLENGEGPSEFNPQLEKQIYRRRDTLYRNEFFYILTVNAVLVVLWIFSIVENGNNTQSITAPNAILESCESDLLLSWILHILNVFSTAQCHSCIQARRTLPESQPSSKQRRPVGKPAAS